MPAKGALEHIQLGPEKADLGPQIVIEHISG